MQHGQSAANTYASGSGELCVDNKVTEDCIPGLIGTCHFQMQRGLNSNFANKKGTLNLFFYISPFPREKEDVGL